MLQGQPPTLAQAWDLAEALDVSITDMLPLETDPRPPGLDRLIDAVRQGDAAEARAALSALVGVPTVPNPEDPHGARLLDAVARADAVDIRRALEVMLPPGTYTAVTSAPPQADLIRAVEQATTGLQALGALMKGARPPDES